MLHLAVPLADGLCHLARAQYIEGVVLEVDDIAHVFDLADAQRIAALEDRTVLVDSFPVHTRVQAVRRDRTYLQHMEDLRVVLEVRRELDLYRRLDLLLGDIE